MKSGNQVRSAQDLIEDVAPLSELGEVIIRVRVRNIYETLNDRWFFSCAKKAFNFTRICNLDGWIKILSIIIKATVCPLVIIKAMKGSSGFWP